MLLDHGEQRLPPFRGEKPPIEHACVVSLAQFGDDIIPLANIPIRLRSTLAEIIAREARRDYVWFDERQLVCGL
jgi:hypothetical protein